jgi:hypothetical protein
MATCRQKRLAIPVSDQPSNTTNVQPQASAPDDGEFFNLDVSGSDRDSEEAVQPARQAHKRATVVAVPVDQMINDPTPVQDSKKAADVRYYFERQDDKNVCRVCK